LSFNCPRRRSFPIMDAIKMISDGLNISKPHFYLALVDSRVQNGIKARVPVNPAVCDTLRPGSLISEKT